METQMLNFRYTIPTDGRTSLWSNHKTDVEVVCVNVTYMNDEEDFGELRVYFNPKTWNVREHGLIYTDKSFITGLRAALTDAGLNGKDVDYSEQGMQGNNYVSCDVGRDFLDSWKELLNSRVAA
jgi:hypothetical protein